MITAVCPGSFDPVTSGHLDVIERCAQLFDKVYVLVAVNAVKQPLFNESERVQMIESALAADGCANVEVQATSGLITDFCSSVGASVIVKGLRQNGDYEAELGMALVNRSIGGIETLFIPADPIKEHISSSIVKDVARHGGDVTGMVPSSVKDRLSEALDSQQPAREWIEEQSHTKAGNQ